MDRPEVHEPPCYVMALLGEAFLRCLVSSNGLGVFNIDSIVAGRVPVSGNGS